MKLSSGSSDNHQPSNAWAGLLHRSPPSTYTSAASTSRADAPRWSSTGCRRTGSDMDIRTATRTGMWGVVLGWQYSVIIRVTLVTGTHNSRPHRSRSWRKVTSAEPV